MILIIFLFLVNFLRTLLFIIVIFYAVRLFSRYVLPLLINKGMKNMQEKMNNQQRQYRQSNRREGEVTIEYGPEKKRPASDKKGEYVDFEEVD